MNTLLFACASLHAPIYANDFSSADDLSAFDAVHRGDNASIVVDPQDASNTALRIDVDRGEFYGGSLQVVLKEHTGAEPTRLYFRYRLWIDPSWTTETGGKLPGFGGTYSRAGWGGKPSDGRNGWSARGLFAGLDNEGRVPIGSYIYHADMVEKGQTYGNSERWEAALERGRWYLIEQEIQLDDVDADGGMANGWLRSWVDNELVFHRKHLHVRDTDELRIETVWLNVYHGGKTPSPNDTHLLIDDLWIGATRPDRPAETGPDREPRVDP